MKSSRADLACCVFDRVYHRFTMKVAGLQFCPTAMDRKLASDTGRSPIWGNEGSKFKAQFFGKSVSTICMYTFKPSIWRVSVGMSMHQFSSVCQRPYLFIVHLFLVPLGIVAGCGQPPGHCGAVWVRMGDIELICSFLVLGPKHAAKGGLQVWSFKRC